LICVIPGAPPCPTSSSPSPRSQLTQTINPWSWTFGNVSLFSINLGKSAAPDVEARILDEVGSYGRQLGRIGEALAVVIAWAEQQGMPEDPRRSRRSSCSCSTST
jgi:hypothetical protein